MTLASLLNSHPSEDEQAQRAELKQAREKRRTTKGKLLQTLKSCQADSVKLTERLVEAVKDAEGLDDIEDNDTA